MLQNSLYMEHEAGVDEAGRGPLAGSLFAAAVILPRDFNHPLLDDSKKMTERNRLLLRDVIQRQAIAWAVAEVDAAQIDRINILNATYQAMNCAVAKLTQKPAFLLIDGNRFKNSCAIPHECIVKGDGKFASIAAASVLAKTYRDEYMMKLHEEYPMYGWDSNKGYPTKAHKEALARWGLTPYHRITFNSAIK